MFKRLNTDTGVAHLTVQFVPLKVTTSGAEWSQWARQYPPDGRAIPFIYVIRADGKMLYGKSGTLPGEALGELMLTSLEKSGRIFNPQQVIALKDTIKLLQAAIELDEFALAAKTLAPPKHSARWARSKRIRRLAKS